MRDESFAIRRKIGFEWRYDGRQDAAEAVHKKSRKEEVESRKSEQATAALRLPVFNFCCSRIGPASRVLISRDSSPFLWCNGTRVLLDVMGVKRMLTVAMAIASPMLSPVAHAQRVEVDQAVARQYKQTLVSGGELVYPAEALKLKQGGTGVFVMFLRPDGTVKSVNIERSTGSAIIDAETKRTLLTYRFKPDTIPTQVFPVTFNPHKY